MEGETETKKHLDRKTERLDDNRSSAGRSWLGKTGVPLLMGESAPHLPRRASLWGRSSSTLDPLTNFRPRPLPPLKTDRHHQTQTHYSYKIIIILCILSSRHSFHSKLHSSKVIKGNSGRYPPELHLSARCNYSMICRLLSFFLCNLFKLFGMIK